jgi:hypothetical protein
MSVREGSVETGRVFMCWMKLWPCSEDVFLGEKFPVHLSRLCTQSNYFPFSRIIWRGIFG